MTALLVIHGPEWFFGLGAIRSKAHLYAEGRDRQAQSWCGFALEDVPAPYAERCKLCLSKLNDYRLAAVVPVPDLVTEVVTVQVTRPSTADETATSYLTRALSRKTSWGVAIVGDHDTKESDS